MPVQTYDDAREQLGGEPWQPKPEATEQWFRPESAGGTAKVPALDTNAISLKRPMTQRAKLFIVGGAAGFVIVLCAVSLIGGAHATPPPLAIATPPPAIASPPPVAATPAPPPAKQKVVTQRTSASVQALFGPAATTSSKHVAAKKHPKKRRR